MPIPHIFWFLKVFDELYAALPATIKQIQGLSMLAAGFNVSLIAYEAGPGLVQDGVIGGGGGATGAVTSLLIATARDDRMQTFYEDSVRALKNAGLFVDRDRPLPVFASAGPFRLSHHDG
jgi:hypothetical protein